MGIPVTADARGISPEWRRRIESCEAGLDKLEDASVIHRIEQLEKASERQDSNWSWLLRTVFASVFLAFVAAIIIAALRIGGGS